MTQSNPSIPTEIVKSGLQWIHPSSSLIRGKVNYGVKMMGFTEVGATTGNEVIQDAIHAIKNANENSTTPQKPVKVELSINVSEVQISDAKTKKLLHSHPLKRISFCSDHQENRRIFAYIATDESQKDMCFVFYTNNNAEQIALTIGQAFDLAVQEHHVKEITKYMPSEEVNKLKAKIQELESEIEILKFENDYYRRKYGNITKSPPPIPNTPIPKPPSGFSLPGCGNPFKFPSSNSPPPLDRAPSLEYHKSASTPAAYVPVSPLHGIDLDCHKKIDIHEKEDVAVNPASDENKKADLKLFMHQISQSDNIHENKSDSPDSNTHGLSPSDVSKTWDVKKEDTDDDDDYMIPRYKLTNPSK